MTDSSSIQAATQETNQVTENATKEVASGFAMQAPESLTDSTVHITQSAVDRLMVLREQHLKAKDLNTKKVKAPALRISVLSGGCYGFQYKFDFDETLNEDDYEFIYKDIRIVVDTTSYDLLENVTLDYVQDLIGAAFTLRNPNSESSCGCGNSFSL